MEISGATEPSPESPNDDAFVCGAGFAAVLDGATAPHGRNSGCSHDVPWLVRHLAGHLSHLLSVSSAALTDTVAAAISATVDDHSDSCDMSNPDSPSSTVTVVRRQGDTLEYLVLGDSPLCLFAGEEAEVMIDDRVEHLADYSYATVARSRNAPGGFWVASTRPEAADQALHGKRPVASLSRALLMTDGASRLVERYGYSWPELASIADKAGPAALVREAHAADAAVSDDALRGKRYDDATAVLCRIAY